MEKTHRIDPLDVITSRSSQEVFTPPKTANLLLDLLPAEVWKNPNILWVDPVTKSGVLLREIRRRLMEGLTEAIPNVEARFIHIMNYQVLAFSTSEISALTARKTLFGIKTVTRSPLRELGIRDSVFVPAPEKNPPPTVLAERLLREGSYANEDHTCASIPTMIEFIKSKRLRDRINLVEKVIIVGNPPYQEADGGHGTSARPIYQLFIQHSQQFCDELVFVIPARWYTGGKGLSDFRQSVLGSNQVKNLRDFPDSREVFPNAEIGGGVCFLHWVKDYNGLCNYSVGNGPSTTRNLNARDVFVRDNVGLEILHKVESAKYPSFAASLSAHKPFGLRTFFHDFCDEGKDAIPCLTKDGTKHVKRKHIEAGADLIPIWKLAIGRGVFQGGAPSKDGKYRVLNTCKVLPANHVCLETYFVTTADWSAKEAQNAADYCWTKFVRFLLKLRTTSQNMSRDTFEWVPILDFTKRWTDEDLYRHFNLSKREIEHIEKVIK